MAQDGSGRALYAFLFGNLVIGTGIMLPAGVLNPLAADFGITPAQAGWLMTAGGLVVGIGAPLLAGWTASVDRRRLLAAALALYVLGHAGAALAPNFALTLVCRVVAVIGAAIFTPQAAATAGLLVPPERRGAAIAFIFVGWSLASVIGIPLATLGGELIGWRATSAAVAVLALAAAALVLAAVPRGLRVSPLPLAVWLGVLRDARLMLVLAVTAAAMAGQFVIFTYVSAVLAKVHGLDGQGAALAFLFAGAFGVAGNALAGRLVARLGVSRLVMLSLGAIGAGMAVAGLGWTVLAGFVAGLCLWNLGGFAVNSMQQARLVGLAPALAPATVALNTSFVYLGQAAGSATGGVLIGPVPGRVLALAALGFVALAAALSHLATRQAGPAAARGRSGG